MTLGNALGQTAVNTVPAPAFEGDFCDSNPRYTYDAGPGGLVAGSAGLTVGRFAWATYPPDADNAPSVANNNGVGPVAGFVHREQQGLLTTYLQTSSMLVPAGFPVTIHTGGGFWAKNAGATYAKPGQKAFAKVSDGTVSFADAGTVPGGSSAASTAIVKTTLTLVGSVSDNILTVASVSAGTVYPGAVLSSNAAGQIVEQLTGVAGGAGTYLLDTGEQTVAAGTTIGGFYGLMTNGTVTGDDFAVGDLLTGSGVPTGDSVYYIVTNGGTSGVLVASMVDAVSSTTIVGSPSVETKWTAMSGGGVGDLIKISDKPLG